MQRDGGRFIHRVFSTSANKQKHLEGLETKSSRSARNRFLRPFVLLLPSAHPFPAKTYLGKQPVLRPFPLDFIPRDGDG